MNNESLFNLKVFHESTTKELDAIKNRVRNLIGDSNWSEEGRYKEAILKNVIKRFLPKKFIVGTGFIVKTKNNNRYECSKQIDILIFDSSYPVLFSEGDFHIITPNSVKSIIEVKTNLENQDIQNTIKKMNSIEEFVGVNKRIFNGIFSFEGYSNSKHDLKNKIKDKIETNFKIVKPSFVNHICLNPNIFMKRWNSRFSVYKLDNLSFSYFISNLIYYVTDKPIENESRAWFPTNKEYEKLFDINLDNQNDN